MEKSLNEIAQEITESDKKVLAYLLSEIKKNHRFHNWEV